MAGTSEMSYGAKLRRAYDLLSIIEKAEAYQPPRQEESIEQFGEYVKKLETANVSSSNLRNTYKVSVDERFDAFRKADDSMEKNLAPIRGSVLAQYGKSSTQMTIVVGIIRKIRSTKLTKPPVDPTNPASKQAVSDSQRSYGSATQFFNDLVNALENFPNYAPSNEKIRVPALKERFDKLHKLNNDVISSTQDMQVAVADRKALFEDLKDRTQRIKSYVKAQYGVKSQIYKAIKGLKF